MGKKFSIAERLRSFRFAAEGFFQFFKSEHNAWLHLLGTIAVIIMAILFPVSRVEAIALCFAVGIVWMAELFNTAIEKMMDFISIEKNPKIKLIKDLSAAAVLMAAITALVVGCIVFIPKF